MNRIALIIIALLTAQTFPLGADDGRDLVKRSLPFIEREGAEWMADRRCVTCHQVPSMLSSLNRAASAGFDVDPDKLAKWSDWSVNWKNWMTGTNVTTEAKAAAANVETMAHLLLGRRTADKDAAWVTAFRDHLLKFRDTNGVWKAGGQLPLGRRPARETQEVTTMWAQLALKSVTSSETPAEVYERIAKWLSLSQPGKSTEWWTLQLLTHREFGRQSEVEATRRKLLVQQNSDGGWGWLVGEPSDAFGTGLALYAFGRTGLTARDPALGRAIEFLKTTQTPDGSWAVPSTRAKDNKKIRETSSYWGTAWAARGIIETLPHGDSHRAEASP